MIMKDSEIIENAVRNIMHILKNGKFDLRELYFLRLFFDKLVQATEKVIERAEESKTATSGNLKGGG